MKRLICAVVGHRWEVREYTAGHHLAGLIGFSVCRRCNRSARPVFGESR